MFEDLKFYILRNSRFRYIIVMYMYELGLLKIDSKYLNT